MLSLISHACSGQNMANLSVRQLDDNTLQALRMQAAKHGVSMEEEARRILRSAVRPSQKLGDLAVSLFQPAWYDDENGNGNQPFKVPEREHDEALDFSE